LGDPAFEIDLFQGIVERKNPISILANVHVGMGAEGCGA
jgi:hypothetical protein